MNRLLLTRLLMVIVGLGFLTGAWSGGVGRVERVSAQAAAEDPYSYRITQQEQNEYYAAIQNCETPSLECLVRYTTRFVAIEWVNELQGPNIEKVQDLSGGTTSQGSSGGVIGGLSSMIGMMYENPAASTGTYVADLVQGAGFATPAYAQGLGFASLNPILELWKTFRNVAYFFFIIFFIVIGLMIMFRFKIGGQTAVTAQQAIPSVIISLILVTFSYAIAGFMIDLMYLSMYMIIGIFSNSALTASLGNRSLVDMLSMDIFELGGMLFTTIWGQLETASSTAAEIMNSIGGIADTLSWAGRIFGGLTITLIISIAVVIGVFKLFFELLKSYFIIVAAVVTAPIILMFGALPGRNVFWPWLKNIIGNLAAFPAVLLVVILFMQFTTQSRGGGGGFMPPFLIGSGQSGMLGYLIGLATILALPELVKKIKEVMGAGDGGFGSFIAGAAWGGFKEGWGGKMPLGLNARNIAGTVGMGALMGSGAGIGAGIGSIAALRRGGNVKDGALRGALIGGLSPVGARMLPSVARDSIGIAKQELGELATEESIGGLLNRASREQGVFQQVSQKIRTLREKHGRGTKSANTAVNPNNDVLSGM